MPPCDRGGNGGDAARLRARATLGGDGREQDGSGGVDGDGVPARVGLAWRATAGARSVEESPGCGVQASRGSVSGGLVPGVRKLAFPSAVSARFRDPSNPKQVRQVAFGAAICQDEQLCDTRRADDFEQLIDRTLF